MIKINTNLFKNFKFIFAAFFLAALITTIQHTFFHESNNYKIFYNSLKHLLANTSLYTSYPSEHFDYFLYSPSFPVIFSPFFLLPYKAGLFMWHLFFAAVWVVAVYKMPLSDTKKVFMYWFGFQELLTALGNSQTNPLIAAIPLFAFICFEKNKTIWAAFFIILGFEIKIYSLVTGALFLLYPKKGKLILACIFWLIVFALLPLLIVSPAELIHQYALWFERLVIRSESDKFGNVSIHRIIHQTISENISTSAIIGGGVLVFCSVFIHIKAYVSEKFRMFLLASVLIFQIIFSPASESATYISAITGVAIWWLYAPKTALDYILVIGCFILTVMGPTDFMPAYIKKNFIIPHVLKAWPCALIWLRIIYLMHVEGLTYRADTEQPSVTVNYT